MNNSKKYLFTCLLLSVLATSQSTNNLVVSNKNDLESYARKVNSNQVSSREVAIIYTILANTNEVIIHQQNCASDNVVYLHKDGHSEAVYDKYGKLVKDGINDGSYNYFHPSKEPLKHFAADISPWIMLGNSPKDTTTVQSRIYAYMGDLEGGIRRAVKQKNNLPQVAPHEQMQIQTLDMFFKAISAGGADDIFLLFSPENQLTDQKLITVLTKLNKGFNQIYAQETR